MSLQNIQKLDLTNPKYKLHVAAFLTTFIPQTPSEKETLIRILHGIFKAQTPLADFLKKNTRIIQLIK